MQRVHTWFVNRGGGRGEEGMSTDGVAWSNTLMSEKQMQNRKGGGEEEGWAPEREGGDIKTEKAG